MNKLILSDNGFPGTNHTWRFLQTALTDAITALTQALGDKVIISGVEPDGDNVTAGIIIVNNEIFQFEAGTIADTITIIENVETRPYKVDYNDDDLFENLPAYTTRTARCGTGGIVTFNFSELVRLTKLQDVYQPTQATASQLGLVQFSNLVENQQALINNKAVSPEGLRQYFNVYRKETNVYIGDVAVEKEVEVSIYPPLPDTNYIVLGTIRSPYNSSNHWYNDDLTWILSRKFTDKFRIMVAEWSGVVNNAMFDYILIKL